MGSKHEFSQLVIVDAVLETASTTTRLTCGGLIFVSNQKLSIIHNLHIVSTYDILTTLLAEALVMQ